MYKMSDRKITCHKHYILCRFLFLQLQRCFLHLAKKEMIASKWASIYIKCITILNILFSMHRNPFPSSFCVPSVNNSIFASNSCSISMWWWLMQLYKQQKTKKRKENGIWNTWKFTSYFARSVDSYHSLSSSTSFFFLFSFSF